MTKDIWIEQQYSDVDATMRKFKYDKTWMKVNSDGTRERVRVVKYGIEHANTYTVFYMLLNKHDEYGYVENNNKSCEYTSTLESVISIYDLKNENNNEIIRSVEDLY
jgi:hypothetical protein